MTEWCVMSLDRWAEVTVKCGFYSYHNEKPLKCFKQESDTDLFFLKVSLELPRRELTLEGRWQEWNEGNWWAAVATFHTGDGLEYLG